MAELVTRLWMWRVAHHAVMGILATVIQRQQTGEGQFIDISMTDAAFSLNAVADAAALAGGQSKKPQGGMLNGGTFYDYCQAKDGRWLSVGSLEPQFSAPLCEILGLGDMKSLATSQKPKHQQALKAAIREKIAARTLAEWRRLFADVDGCMQPVFTIEEAAEHPQARSRGMVVGIGRGDGER